MCTVATVVSPQPVHPCNARLTVAQQLWHTCRLLQPLHPQGPLVTPPGLETGSLLSTWLTDPSCGWTSVLTLGMVAIPRMLWREQWQLLASRCGPIPCSSLNLTTYEYVNTQQTKRFSVMCFAQSRESWRTHHKRMYFGADHTSFYYIANRCIGSASAVLLCQATAALGCWTRGHQIELIVAMAGVH